jgi:ribonuclease BN (tRNA processing enzyme)
LAAQGVDYRELDFVLISHLHTDHVLDLLTLLQAYNATPGWQRKNELTIIGCQGIEDFLEQQFSLFEAVAPESYPLRIYEMSDGSMEFQSWSLASTLTMHTSTSLAYRISDGRKFLAYSGDSSDPESLAGLAQEVDLLLCECSLPEGWETSDHLSPTQIGKLAQKAQVGRVVLTHRYPPAIQADVVSQVRVHFNGEVIAATDGWSTTV